MAPHCDTMDGPLVKAARRALETANVKLILPWVYKGSEEELQRAFEKTLSARKGATSGTEDFFDGGAGNDTLFGGYGPDIVDGRDGVVNNDYLHGGYQDVDTCYGDPDPKHEC